MLDPPTGLGAGLPKGVGSGERLLLAQERLAETDEATASIAHASKQRRMRLAWTLRASRLRRSTLALRRAKKRLTQSCTRCTDRSTTSTETFISLAHDETKLSTSACCTN